MRVFMTGGSGFVGSFLVGELLSRGHALTLLTRKGITDWGTRVEVVVGGLADFDRAQLRGHDAVIHNAIVWEDERQLHDVRLSRALFEAAAEVGVERAIYTSSAAVHRPHREIMNEETPLAPEDLYGATKAASEMMLWSTLRGDVVRAGPVVGGRAFMNAPFKPERRLAEIVRATRAGEDVHVGRSEGIQCIGGADLAKVYATLLERPAGGTYLATSADFVTWEEIAREIIELTCSSSRVVVQDRGVAPARFDVSKLERQLGLRFEARGAITDHLSVLVAST